MSFAEEDLLERVPRQFYIKRRPLRAGPGEPSRARGASTAKYPYRHRLTVSSFSTCAEFFRSALEIKLKLKTGSLEGAGEEKFKSKPIIVVLY